MTKTLLAPTDSRLLYVKWLWETGQKDTWELWEEWQEKHDYAKVQQATVRQVRNDALEEAAKLCDSLAALYTDMTVPYDNGFARSATLLAESMRTLQSPSTDTVSAHELISKGYEEMRKNMPPSRLRASLRSPTVSAEEDRKDEDAK